MNGEARRCASSCRVYGECRCARPRFVISASAFNSRLSVDILRECDGKNVDGPCGPGGFNVGK